jgi:hypothetical protein
MAWKNGRYFYRSVRRGGRVETLYFGRGEAAEREAERLAEDRRRREAGDRATRARREELEALARAQAGRFARVEVVVRAALEAAGFHRHRRGAWRRRRRPMSEATQDQATVPALEPTPPAVPDEIRDVVDRARRGDASALPRLRELIRADPDRMFLVVSADLAAHAEGLAIAGIVGPEDLAAAEGIRVKLGRMREALAGPGSPAIERLLAERAALCWLDCYGWELRHLAATRGEGPAPREAEHWQKMRGHAHRRYLQALKALATVKKLGPVVQVNIARNQVNMQGG